MTENTKKWWKLAFIAVPALISGGFSYAKARAESKDESKAAYEALSKAFSEAKKDADEDHDHLVKVEAQLSVLMELYEKQSARMAELHPGSKPKDRDGDGVPDRFEPPKPFSRKPTSPNAGLPMNFDDVVQQYKAKK